MDLFFDREYGDYPDLSGVKRILVVKLRHLGDVLLTTPFLKVLKKNSRAKVDVYVYGEAREVLANNPYVDGILTCDRGQNLFKEIGILKGIRSNGYDLVINLTEGDRGAIAALVSGAKYRVGFDPGKSGFWNKRKIYTHLVKIPSSRHTVEKNLDALRRIGIFSDEKELFFHVGEETLRRMSSLGDFILIHPTSRWRFKCWPHVVELARELQKEGKKIVFVSGGAKEEVALVDRIVKELDGGSITNLAGRVSLEEFGALIKLSKFFLCVDSLGLHLSSALKAKTLVFFGPTSDISWGPWQNPNAKVFKANFSCQPCSLDGCGGSKVAECLRAISYKEVLNYIVNESPK